MGKAKLAKDNTKALTYASEMAGPPVGRKVARKVAQKDSLLCRTCGLPGHVRVSHQRCLMSTHPKSVRYKVGKRLEYEQPLEGQCV